MRRRRGNGASISGEHRRIEDLDLGHAMYVSDVAVAADASSIRWPAYVIWQIAGCVMREQGQVERVAASQVTEFAVSKHGRAVAGVCARR